MKFQGIIQWSLPPRFIPNRSHNSLSSLFNTASKSDTICEVPPNQS